MDFLLIFKTLGYVYTGKASETGNIYIINANTEKTSKLDEVSHISIDHPPFFIVLKKIGNDWLLYVVS